MKTLAILLATALSLTTGCATDDETYRTGAPGLRPGYKPSLADSLQPPKIPDDSFESDEVFDPGTPEIDSRRPELDGRLGGALGEWAEDILIDGQRATIIHIGEQILVLDETGEVVDEGLELGEP